ncbi:hypothetical protein CLOM_g14681 [Closterium sp. NIES-68]|nr:hypothetical protein CLOM_g14681 [Closterium sp. NIES-68]GJP84004.1 hypothetical protein CLOP_g14098 [Closterium sp. NIES-67]
MSIDDSRGEHQHSSIVSGASNSQRSPQQHAAHFAALQRDAREGPHSWARLRKANSEAKKRLLGPGAGLRATQSQAATACAMQTSAVARQSSSGDASGLTLDRTSAAHPGSHATLRGTHGSTFAGMLGRTSSVSLQAGKATSPRHHHDPSAHNRSEELALPHYMTLTSTQTLIYSSTSFGSSRGATNCPTRELWGAEMTPSGCTPQRCHSYPSDMSFPTFATPVPPTRVYNSGNESHATDAQPFVWGRGGIRGNDRDHETVFHWAARNRMIMKKSRQKSIA